MGIANQPRERGPEAPVETFGVLDDETPCPEGRGMDLPYGRGAGLNGASEQSVGLAGIDVDRVSGISSISSSLRCQVRDGVAVRVGATERDAAAARPTQLCMAHSVPVFSVVNDHLFEAERSDEKADGGPGVTVGEVWPEECVHAFPSHHVPPTC